MEPEILRDAPVAAREIEDLREAVGWDRCGGMYERILRRHWAHYTAWSEEGELIGYVSVLSDGIADAFLVDLMVHPAHRHGGLGSRLVTRAVADVKQAGIRCVQVTFNEGLEAFYARCGFHVFKGGIIDFGKMEQGRHSQRE